ncbi:hypothetical protein TYRP_016598 [Tyrophagus putrescentiae]|nr:hypothetical protein TYRP_016598 [Tyrophagus putrescentiae]
MSKNIIIDTGNVFSPDIVQRLLLRNPNEEVIQGIENILTAYCGNKCEATVVKVLDKDVTYVASGVDLSHDPKKLGLSIKLFTYPETYQSEDDETKQALINEAITSIVQLLNVNRIDDLTLSIQDSQVDRVVPVLKTFWSVLENYKTSGTIHELSTSDLSRDQLRELFQAAKVKPTSSNINLDACCDIPDELTAFSKEFDFKLYTHNDPLADFAPPDRIRSLFNSLKGGDKSCKLLEQICPSGGGKSAITRRWIARYTLILSGQGVLISKGYLVSLSIADQ